MPVDNETSTAETQPMVEPGVEDNADLFAMFDD